ncbi:hypothetical protein ACQKDL_18835, partial [Pseudomonas bubulae]
IMTGTPVGVGPLNVGDELVLELTGVSRFESSPGPGAQRKSELR